MTTPLEDRLSRLADGTTAAATPEVRAAIGRRTTVLRRRRRVREAAGAGFLVLAAVAGVAVTRNASPQDRTDVSGPGGEGLPALVLDVAGWEVVMAENTVAGASVAPNDGSVQVFQRPGDPEGPRIVLRHTSSSDALGPAGDLDEEVTVRGVTGFLRETGADGLTLRWSPPLGDNTAEVEATGLSRDELLDFAEGLTGKDDSISFPPSSDDEFGFVADVLPRGVVEVPPSEPTLEDAPARRLVAEGPGATAELTVEATGDAGYETLVADLAEEGAVEDVTVMGQPAVLVEYPRQRGWSVAWQPQPDTTARLVLAGLDRTGVEAVIGGLDEATGSEWDTLVAMHGR